MLECELDPWFRWWFQTALSPVWRTTGPAVIIVTMSELSDARMRSGAARDNVERLLEATPETDMNAEQRTKLEAAEAAVVRVDAEYQRILRSLTATEDDEQPSAQ